MKTRIGLIIVAIIVSSCMSYHCPTYDGSMGHTTMASSKKPKAAKHRASKKVTKQAEKD